MKKKLFVLFCILLTGITFSLTRNGVELVYSYENLAPTSLAGEQITPDYAQVVRVVDGDTIKVKLPTGTETVRLIGVDTPETVHPTKAVEAYGQEASEFLKSLCETDQDVYLSYDWDHRDVYKRLLGYLWIIGDDGEWVLANLAIVENGFGYAYLQYTFRKDYMEIFAKAQEKAQEKGYGLWSETPAPSAGTVKQGDSKSTVEPDPQKGRYIGNVKSKVLHDLDCGSLPAESNRIYFQTYVEAIKAGYKPCSKCKPSILKYWVQELASIFDFLF